MLERNNTESAVSTKKRRINNDILKDLEKKFEAINIFCAFCDARLTTAVTFQSLQKAVANLTIEDLAAINVIIPDFVKFNPISKETLEIEFGSSISHNKNNVSNKFDNDEFNFNKSVPVIKPKAVKKHIQQQNTLFKKSLNQFIKECKEKNIVNTKDHLLYELEKYIPMPYIEEDDLFNSKEENKDNMSISQLIEGFKSLSFYHDQLDNVAVVKSFPSKMPILGDIHNLVSDQLKTALKEKGINNLYIHQTEALKSLLLEKQHVIVSTSTASGKSLIYQIPVLESLIKDKSSTAMYIFPTKALAQDQMRSLKDILCCVALKLDDIQICSFDGDTPVEQRSSIRNHANVIFTNPDMLHHAILPNSKLWNHFLLKLRYVVVDELHVYNGLFGTHVAFIMRRLRRLCHLAGNTKVQFISCSATISNPVEHMKNMFGINDNINLVDIDGAPHGKKEFIIWNPPIINPAVLDTKSEERRGAIAEGADILEYLLLNNIRTIAFCKMRKSCELLMKQVRENLQKKDRKEMMNKVMSYRGGYTVETRRKIEGQMFNGELLGIIATNALELGIDIGSLDAVLMVGVPWSISALWQQSGRSGRRNADSLSLVICDNNPLDQHYARHPEELFLKKADTLSINLENMSAIEGHLQCAAEEAPIDPINDQVYFGCNLPTLCQELLTEIDNGLYRPDPRLRPYPSQYVRIRNINDDLFAVVDVTDNRNVVLEEVELHRVGFELYEGAVFIHQGRTYVVEECNIDKRYSKIHLARVNWTTSQRDYTDVDATSTKEMKYILNTNYAVSLGSVNVSTVVFGYYRIDKSKRIIDSHDVYMDPIITESNGIWVDVPGPALTQLKISDINPMAAIHAASHCLISLLPRFTHSSVTDVRTECKNPHATRPRPARITLYETQPMGIIRQAYRLFDDLLKLSIKQIENCPCEFGCPSCIHLTFCSEYNEVCSKQGALILLKSLYNEP
ncbi:P-loop containing nucleoside triphosphate hydrolase protein [Cokeromyces recurvatus]|uniref:P-loop containing nucleoside triphosphate hydrolase protein n=1 Tax=Cokeromyces recurvatus TaxID=90255 RepID=UPI00221EB23E|nr:P-loop containing nucleoside triphosphate hydrolase protein [Cokeromyces recurvatus]KAI7901494.1 P-loop containing nucleoside triphosphate hydrolase protein [Cokeromyces recurvatus]